MITKEEILELEKNCIRLFFRYLKESPDDEYTIQKDIIKYDVINKNVPFYFLRNTTKNRNIPYYLTSEYQKYIEAKIELIYNKKIKFNEVYFINCLHEGFVFDFIKSNFITTELNDNEAQMILSFNLNRYNLDLSNYFPTFA